MSSQNVEKVPNQWFLFSFQSRRLNLLGRNIGQNVEKVENNLNWALWRTGETTDQGHEEKLAGVVIVQLRLESINKWWH